MLDQRGGLGRSQQTKLWLGVMARCTANGQLAAAEPRGGEEKAGRSEASTQLNLEPFISVKPHIMDPSAKKKKKAWTNLVSKTEVKHCSISLESVGHTCFC